MIDILPIDKIRDEDAPLFGSEIVNLAKLSNTGFPVAPGIAVAAPEFRFKSLLNHYDLKDREVFEASIEIIKKDIERIPPPEEFLSELKNKKIDSKKLWLSLLNIWLSEIRTKIWREGLSDSAAWNLSAQTVFFINQITLSGKAYRINQSVAVDLTAGELTDKQKLEISEQVIKMDKELVIPQVYHFVEANKKILFVRLNPSTPNPLDEPVEDGPINEIPDKKVPRSGVKVFLDLSEGLEVTNNIDGVIICAEKSSDFDSLVFRLVESATTFHNLPVIFKLSDLIEHKAGVRGTLRLIHQKSLLKTEVEAFLFARRKKDLLNLSMAIPFVRSINEFLEIKRDIASLGISRKGTLKLWLEVCVPENIINLEEYITAGLDGLILNLDELSSFLGGFDPEIAENIFYKKQVSALIKLLKEPMKLTHKSRVPVIAIGELALHDEVIDFLVDSGVYGIISSVNEAQSLNEHLRFIEKRVVRKRLG